MKFNNVFYLPSGRIFVMKTKDDYFIECTEMRDVSVDGKLHKEVRETENPRIVWDHLVDHEKKWLMTVSTQVGCPHNCKFCDVGNIKYKRNLTSEEIIQQIMYVMDYTSYVKQSDKVKIGFARMGEPAHNINNVLIAIKSLPICSTARRRNFNWLPCFNSILPTKTIEGYTAYDIIDKVIEVKEVDFNGFLHFQISCNSTNESQRKQLFDGASVLSIEDTIKCINRINITNRTVTLNFIVFDGVEIDVRKLMKYGLNPDKFVVKLIPMNETMRSVNHNLKAKINYSNYSKFYELEKQFKDCDIPVCFDAIAKCEEAGLCCGQLAQNVKIYQ